MKILKIYSLDDPEETTPITELVEGEHTIGREKLNCKDKRISRNHAIIIINDTINLKSTHINPSFYKPNGGNSIQLITKDNSITLNDGDQFALLPTEFWFRIRINEDRCLKRNHADDQNNESFKKTKLDALQSSEESFDFGYSNNTSKHENQLIHQDPSHEHISGDDTDLEDKQIEESTKNTNGHKETVSDSDESLDLGESYVKENNNTPEKKPVSDSEESLDLGESLVEQNNSPVIERKPVSDSEESLDLGEPLVKENNQPVNERNPVSDSKESLDLEKPSLKDYVGKTKPVSDSEENLDLKESLIKDNEANDNPSTSKVKRNRCWYGNKCYRKNPLHRSDYSHVGDSDYDEDSNNDPPSCPFGDACYRTNLNHRKQYKHLKPPATKPSVNDDSSGDETPRKKKRKAAAKQKTYAETPEDDYDFNDPFINDASSDDFKVSEEDESNDSDWQDSQEVNEESQDTRRLLKEAKKFTKKK